MIMLAYTHRYSSFFYTEILSLNANVAIGVCNKKERTRKNEIRTLIDTGHVREKYRV